MLGGMLAGLILMASADQDPQAQAGRTAQGSPETAVDDVIVQGRSIEQQARAYVGEVTAAPRNTRLAHWDRRVCVSVLGLDATYAHYLVDRISAVAASVDLNPGDPGCDPQVLIAFSRDPDAVARRWIDRDLDTFRPSRSGGTDLGAKALDAFKTSDAPIRWWHVSLPVNAQTGLSVLGGGPNFIATPSLIQSQTRESLVRSFIIVDADQIGQATFGSLADYLSLIALAQVDPGAETGELDTVLNLFSGRSEARLSGWDSNYLQSLYGARTNPIRASIQTRHIARGLTDRRMRDVNPASD